ncbi:MAG: DUF393 domain-containing protein [Planktomarina sp.]|jgi:predicted DCC family thiol-disulfide oxidoreductase YuxK|nr:DUF393 domain-containing protein [Planktomarina sp.]MDT2057973.1 DUF393 domain-containing protein [Planktomarina sp.]MDT2073815.1 DUF393 domain-containing protein [Planktomarina sp.]MDT2077308.1 DUF393 domain-containing protein [Planktomarina sp.]HAJ84210.1 DUF393 domain-containing protein [Paracoccaceae bacterium]|tara:strand:- start:9312 stop:9671 length:360 start_codon:yes stop_codon:yes gene_type:complete
MASLEVLYNAECPICRREIDHYQSLSGDDVEYIKLTPDIATVWGLTEDQAAQQLHARRGGNLIVGVDAFVAIWQRLPYFRVLALIVKFKPIKAISSVVYRLILAPLLFAAHKKRRARSK